MAMDKGTLRSAPRRRNLSPHRVSPVPHWQVRVAHIRYEDAPPAFPQRRPPPLPSARRPPPLPSARRLSPCAHSRPERVP